MKNFKEFMNEERTISRWTVLKIGLTGAFCGALLATIWVITSIAR